MNLHKYLGFLIFLVLMVASEAVSGKEEAMPAGDEYRDLVRFFQEWREFQKPKVVNGVRRAGPSPGGWITKSSGRRSTDWTSSTAC